MAKLNKQNFEKRTKTVNEFYEDFQLGNRVKNLSEMTILYYEQNLSYFFDYLSEVGIELLEDIRKSHIDRYIMWLRDKGLKDTTINTYLRAARALLYFAMREDHLESFSISLIKANAEQKEPYSDEDIKKLIKKPDMKSIGFVEHRNWVMVNYLLETGNRLNTLLNIKIEDIDLENGMVVLTTTKNRKVQYNPISEYLVLILNTYIRSYNLDKDDNLFVNEVKEQLTRNSAQHAIARFNKKRGVKKTSIHAFRHTFAKHYITSGGDAFKLQRLLGHSTLDVTMNYVNLYSSDLKEGFNEHSVLNNFRKSDRLERGKRKL
ncbi:tyrosine-type recombinase/integrase [Halobacillus naozhouensis]|uniref:Tyrosine-type recombinase/integrase n=1 Tax=Halobacillus naozhouensis TaxID=554880 RepID=A0ABY8J0A8_9BACI|nr:tyrosine-type recombinase/integrase [Halobacillus naozhouensis]WFT75932.1 tyrosine-type recombinase/integrase [Halobacillus naozhouensis]